MKFALHRKQKAVCQKAEQWLGLANSAKFLADDQALLDARLRAPGPFDDRSINPVEGLARYYGIEACAALGRGDGAALARPLRWCADFRSLSVRMIAAHNATHPDQIARPLLFQTALRAATPIPAGNWNEAEASAACYLALAEKDQRRQPPRDRILADDSVDPLLAALFSQAFDIATEFVPARPLIPVYAQLLQLRASSDREAFCGAMQAAAEFHVERSKFGGDSRPYEFEGYFDQAFAVELLAIQALRRRDGLPEFETGHALVDSAWRLLRELAPAAPHPLYLRVVETLRAQWPGFR